MATPEITEPDIRSPRRNSTGFVERNSAGKSSSPNYLRASTGSCHDFCKYGTKHAIEVKTRHPIPKRITPYKQKNIGPVVLPERNRKSMVKLKPSSDLKVHSSEQNIRNARLEKRKKTSALKLKSSLDLPEPHEIIKREILPTSKKVSSKQESPNNKLMKGSEMKMTLPLKQSPAAKSKPVTVRPYSFSAVSVGRHGTRNGGSMPAKNTVTSNGKITGTYNGKMTGTFKTAVTKVLTHKTVSVLSPKASGSRVVSLYPRKNSSIKLVSPLKDQDRIQKANTKKQKSGKVPEKTLHVVEAEIDSKVLESVLSDGTIQTSPSPSLQSPKSSSHADSKCLSSNGDDRKESEHIDDEGLEESEYTDDEDIEEYSDSEADEFIYENDEILDIDEVNQNRTPRKGIVILPGDEDEDEDGTQATLKFRRGKVINLQTENNGPRRLRFRQGRVVGDNEDVKSHARRRSFKKKEIDNDTNGTSSSSEKVVLRHQDMQGKKDSQGLFNNVIEETASKLAESRKSKVKALVGAFETVISLQESKPPIQTVT